MFVSVLVKKIVKYDNYDFEYLTYSCTRAVNASNRTVILCEAGLYFVVIVVLEGVALLFFVIAVLLFFKLKNIFLIFDSVMLITLFFNRI